MARATARVLIVPHLPRYAVVMAGGAGTRFWPRSRVHTPKQLLALRGGRSLLQETVARVSPPIRRERVLVVTARPHARAVARQLPRRGRSALLVEPEGRNTAAAIALAALHVARRAPEAVLAVLPADHVIDDLPAFRRDLRLALEVAERSAALVTIGVVPTHAETGYGYVRLGAPRRWSRAATRSGTRASSRGGRAPSWPHCACISPRWWDRSSGRGRAPARSPPPTAACLRSRSTTASSSAPSAWRSCART